MMGIVAVATAMLVAASSWLLGRRARREWRERRLIRAEAAQAIAGLETLLAEHAARGGARPGPKSATGENAPKPQT